MTPPRRPVRRGPPRRTSGPRQVAVRLVLVLVLVAAVVGGAVAAHRWWSSRDGTWAVASGWKYWLGIAPRKSATEVAAERAHAERERAARGGPAAPVLTFYHELTAPLVPAPPPPKAKPAAPERPAAPSAATAGAFVPPPGSPTGRIAAEAAGTGSRFTIQVGAYRTREPAEALRAQLAGSEHEVYIVESEAADGIRYRVRVGAFSTEEAARAAATKLAGERHVATYVTSR